MRDFKVEPIPETFLDRLKKEHAELEERTGKLDLFIGTTPFHQLTDADQDDLVEQLRYMQMYLHVLHRRVTRIVQKH